MSAPGIDVLVREARAGDRKAYDCLRSRVSHRKFAAWSIPEPRRPNERRETVGQWLARDLAKRAVIPGLRDDGWKQTKWAQTHYRILRDGEPLYFAAYVADWAPWMKRALCRGALNRKEESEAQAQLDLLFPTQTSVRNFGRLLESCERQLCYTVDDLTNFMWKALGSPLNWVNS